MITLHDWRQKAWSKVSKAVRFSKPTWQELNILLEKTLALSKPQLIMNANNIELSEKELAQLNQLWDRFLKGEPLAYLIQQQGFWTFDLEINEYVLIPRPDTELLIEKVLAQSLPLQSTVLDLGTGSGAIALALAYEKPQWSIYATDICQKALDVARNNSKKLNFPVKFLLGNWFEAIENNIKKSIQFDLIVSNPPYVAQDDPHLKTPDLQYEPLKALISEDDGLADIKQITTKSMQFLKKEGWLFIEHGYNQGDLVKDLLYHLGFSMIKTYKDLNNCERVTKGCWLK